MSASVPPSSAPLAARLTWRELLPPALGVFALFLAFSAMRMPVPAPNEPHYLAKAKHYWDAGFCPGDFFLDSADAHQVFYQTVGWLTLFLTLEQTAVAGRVLGLALLAAGWTAFTSRLLPGRWGSLWSAGLFLALAAIGNFSGEWIVGGIEAKIFSYGFLFLGLASLFDRRSIWAGLWLGLSISYHPVVGVWGVAALLFAGLVLLILNRRRTLPFVEAEPLFPDWQRLLLSAGVLMAAALPGLIPALALVGAAPHDVRFAADYVVVFYRLKHHLDPMDFSVRQYAGYALLLAFWLATTFRPRPARRSAAWFGWFVMGTVLIACAGLIVGAGPRPATEMPWYGFRMRLMKFYPFRLADIMLPIACAVTLTGWLGRAGRHSAESLGGRFRRDGRWPWLVFAASALFALWVPSRVLETNPSHMPPARLADWKEACRWIGHNAPPDARFFTPHDSWAFKWLAQRAEYVALKDCPQDAAGIVEWNRRLLFRTRWSNRHFHWGYSAAALRELQRETGVTHLLVPQDWSLPLEPLFSNGHYSVYRLAGVGS